MEFGKNTVGTQETPVPGRKREMEYSLKNFANLLVDGRRADIW